MRLWYLFCIYDSLYCISVFAAKDGLSPQSHDEIVACTCRNFLVGSTYVQGNLSAGFAVVTARLILYLMKLQKNNGYR